ncbi:MAG TPA: hypothetical protein VMQ73_11990 [Methylomirabilota bacterium]|nr:hypothetical protein [Methylomirabilota bacterium]
MDVNDQGAHVCQFEDVWVKLRPIFAEAVDNVKRAYTDVFVDQQAFESPGRRFQVYVAFSATPETAQGRREIAISSECGVSLTVNPNLSVSANWGRLTCTSMISDTFSNVTHVVQMGPNTEILLGDERRICRQLDQWTDASVRFFHMNQGLVIERLKAASQQ